MRGAMKEIPKENAQETVVQCLSDIHHIMMFWHQQGARTNGKQTVKLHFIICTLGSRRVCDVSWALQAGMFLFHFYYSSSQTWGFKCDSNRWFSTDSTPILIDELLLNRLWNCLNPHVTLTVNFFYDNSTVDPSCTSTSSSNTNNKNISSYTFFFWYGSIV